MTVDYYFRIRTPHTQMLNTERITISRICVSFRECNIHRVCLFIIVSWCNAAHIAHTHTHSYYVCMSVRLFVCLFLFSIFSLFVASPFSSTLFFVGVEFILLLFVSLINRNLITKINYYRMHGWHKHTHFVRTYSTPANKCKKGKESEIKPNLWHSFHKTICGENLYNTHLFNSHSLSLSL